MSHLPAAVTRCKLCASELLHAAYRMDACKLVILRCGACGFLFVDFVNTDYLHPVDSAWDYPGHAESLARKFDAYCADIERVFPLRDAALLDVGAGGGDFLNQARLRGARVSGLDLDRTGIRFARERFDVTILPARVEEAGLPAGSFDAVTMWEVIEHVNDPRETIRAIGRLLKEGGWFFLSTPCLDSLWDRAGFFLYRASFGWIQFPLTYRFSWAHLQIFSRRHLSTLLAQEGFTIRDFEQRTEFTYPAEGYLQNIRALFPRKIAAFIWKILIRLVPIRNKMVLSAQKISAQEQLRAD